jgi:hypothetical protein
VPQEQDLLHEAAVPAIIIIIMTSVIAASLCKKPSQTIKATTSTWRNLWQNVQI